MDLAYLLKDLPTAPVEGLRIVALPECEDPRDALCARGRPHALPSCPRVRPWARALHPRVAQPEGPAPGPAHRGHPAAAAAAPA
ncbi:hypothetical protein QJS66_22345 [Kocuria rhizophila]|nr:hypothetical protein QJS66_22345 [Kocuria rhizophila]